MYLMNAPPVAAIHTKWRSCGPPRGFSLPLCFNDSDSDLSTNGTPIPDKVQMIIESLRSTQSSLDMGDEVEENVLAGQEAHLQGCKIHRGSNPKYRDPIGSRQLEASSKIQSDMQDSDSDDSVDRGIEEAIQEYLKEKDDHKRKSELTTILSQPSKIPRTELPFPEIPKQNSNSNKVLTASNQATHSDMQSSPITPSMKILMKNKTTFKENPCAKKDIASGAPTKNMPPAVLKSSTFQISTLSDKVTYPLAIKLEDHSSDSSSDDGIEEAIQRYQLEKKEEKHEGSREACKPLTLKAEFDSSSDDGIEEAILCYQLEQQKEHKSVLAPCIPKQQPQSNAFTRYPESTSREDTKTNKLSKKKKQKTDKHSKSPPTHPTSISFIKDRCMSSPKGKGNGVNLSKQESLAKLPSSAPLKANTTAELMCAEAILDISKAVMPKMFNPTISLKNNTLATASTSLLGSSSCMDNNSDGSSVDSEDGIEQEIREFLEQKAQMHKQPSDPASVTATCSDPLKEPDQEKEKINTAQTKALRLSLTQKRRQKEQDHQAVSKDGRVNKDAAVLKPSPLELDRREHSGDKSSSLDSDEDLDTAIKDLLKTKKKLKKKTRDTKLKARKGLADGASSSGKTSPGKKLRSDTGSPKGADTKRKNGNGEKMKGGKSVPQLKWCNKRKESPNQAVEADLSKGSSTVETPSADNSPAIIQIKEESSSVDSDDSIELEIRKFLAEKAKGTAKICSSVSENPCNDFKLENQQAEIPVKRNCPFSDQSPPTGSVWKASDYRVFHNTPSALLTNPNDIPKTFCSTDPQSSPGPVDPVDRAGVAKTEKRRSSLGSREKQSLSVRGQPLTSPNTPVPRPDPETWRQSRSVPEASNASLNRPPFQSRSSPMGESPSATPVHRRADANPDAAPISSSVCSNRTVALFHSVPKTTTTGPRSPFPTSLSPSKPPVRKYFMQGLESGSPWGQLPTPGNTESMLYVAKDENMFVELAPNVTNHVQVRSSETTERRDRRAPGEAKQGRESEREGERGEQRARVQEDFVDETESDERGSPEKRQGFSAL
ncbi:protein phosphatase 1 regulatory subunit 26 [Aplochiton taeniatus]